MGLFRPIKQADKAGAGILTAVFIVGSLLGCWFLNTTVLEGGGAGPKVRDRRRLTRLSRMARGKSMLGSGSEQETLDLSRGSMSAMPRMEEQRPPLPIHLGGTQPT